MKGDFSRDTFDPAKQFSRVLMQQGRVLLDADWNEQTAILLHYLRTLTTDLVGPHWGPKGNAGFEVKGYDNDQKKLTIGAGHYYVDGIFCEQNAESVVSVELSGEKNHLIYLDVWEELVSAVEDDSLRERALGGADTAARAQVRCVVKVYSSSQENGGVNIVSCESLSEVWEGLVAIWQPQGTLAAQVKPANDSTPCLLSPESRYRGVENHLYRIEIHQGGTGESPTFKWSRDNASIISKVTGQGTMLNLVNPEGFASGQWIEIFSAEQALKGEAGQLTQITAMDGAAITIKSLAPEAQNMQEKEQWFARRWDMPDGAMSITGDWQDLEDCIQVKLQKGESYRAGDYWLIPARVADGAITWPVQPMTSDNSKTEPKPQPPHGVKHHYAPLAVLKFENRGWQIGHCRHCVELLAKLC